MPHRFEALRRDAASMEAAFHTMANSIPQLAWMAEPDGSIFWYNQRWYDYTGTRLEEMKGWGWKAVHHPDHVDRVVEKITHAFTTGEPWEDLFPLRSHTGEYRWFLSRALPIRDESGAIQRWFGTNTDVTEQKKSEERQTLLMREIDHRAKNALAVAQAVVSLTKADNVEAYKASVEGRIASLARAHSLLAASRWDGADLKRLISDEIAPYDDKTLRRVTLSGPSIILEPSTAQSLALIVHELSTNAAKYGALSSPDGRLDVTWELKQGEIQLLWQESGIELLALPSQSGFGTTLLDRLIREFAEGELHREWTREGLKAKIFIRTNRDHPSGRKPDPSLIQPAAESHSTNLPSVLIVEDEVLTAMDLEFRIAEAGYRVIGPAGTVEEARELVESDMPKIALLDGNVGGVKSFDLAMGLRVAGVEIVFCTGYEELENLPDGLGDCAVVSKPFRDEVLLDALRQAREKLEEIQ
ncbi:MULTISPECIES: HWE histidine kinase domain-containing protein [Henriciella]|uniref:HWE histidine kinase domain-containing protein n=1 Tax=Henriciella TaxID=453849 RepID=UPI00351462C6